MTDRAVVKMTDGRLVEFSAKRPILKDSWIEDGQVFVRLDFANSETRLFCVPESLVLQFAAYGAGQKIGNEYAGLEDLNDKIQAIDELLARFNQGIFSVPREGGKKESGGSVLAKALIEVTGNSPEAIKAWLAERTAGEKNALRASEKLAPVIARLESERMARSTSGVDTENLFESLGL